MKTVEWHWSKDIPENCNKVSPFVHVIRLCQDLGVYLSIPMNKTNKTIHVLPAKFIKS